MRNVRLNINALLIAGLILFTGCAKEEVTDVATNGLTRTEMDTQLDAFISDLETQAAVYAEENPRDFYGDQAKSPDFLRFNTLREALRVTGLDAAVLGGGITVFCPSDRAFGNIGLTPQNVAGTEGLADILLYHVVGANVFSGDLSNGYVPTLNGAAVNINLGAGGHVLELPQVNDAFIYLFDRERYGTVFHGISEVLLPPTIDIVDVAIGAAPEFTTLVGALVDTGLDDVLRTEGPFTVFAPTNQAFEDLGIDLGTLSQEDLSNILLYHVVQGARVYSSDLADGPVDMANGGSVTIDATNFTVDDSGSADVAGIILSSIDIQGTNGVIHAIDKVLLP